MNSVVSVTSRVRTQREMAEWSVFGYLKPFGDFLPKHSDKQALQRGRGKKGRKFAYLISISPLHTGFWASLIGRG